MRAGDDNTCVGSRGGFNAGDVLEMSVVRGIGGACDMRMCFCSVRGGRCCW